jgi:hypothetical protein
MTPALTRGVKKGIRTVAQVVAGGALTALVTAIAGGLAPSTQALVMGAWIAFVAFAQNWAEGAAAIPVLLPTPALIPIAGDTGVLVAPVAGAVEAVADELGEVTGTVTEVGGGVVGKVTGALKNVAGGVHLRKRGDGGGAPASALMVIGFAILVVVGGFAVCDRLINDESEKGDKHLLGRIQLVNHEYDGEGDGGCWEGECYDGDGGGGGQEYDQNYGSRDDRNRNRNRNRGAFSPGPFDRSPVDAFNRICMPGATCYYEPAPDEGNRND